MKAILLTTQNNTVQAQLTTIDFQTLPTLPIKIKVDYSCLNYKDALAITGKGKIARTTPLVAGIDFAGTILESHVAPFEVGQKVLVTGFGYGEQYHGGLAEFVYASPEHLVLLPDNLTTKQAMTIGTAGLTAVLCVNALLEANITPNKGTVIVTGASGGVGTTAIYLLHKLGYEVSAVSGKTEQYPLLKQLGAKHIFDRQTFATTARPLEKAQYAGLIDTVGGSILSHLLTKLQYHACAALCGLAQSIDLHTSVLPFILRNIRLQGIDSVHFPIEKRALIWQQLADSLTEDYYQRVQHEINLEQACDYAFRLIQGKITGRVIVKVSA